MLRIVLAGAAFFGVASAVSGFEDDQTCECSDWGLDLKIKKPKNGDWQKKKAKGKLTGDCDCYDFCMLDKKAYDFYVSKKGKCTCYRGGDIRKFKPTNSAAAGALNVDADGVLADKNDELKAKKQVKGFKECETIGGGGGGGSGTPGGGCDAILDKGLKRGNDQGWMCPDGYKFPNMAEAKVAAKCLEVPAFTTWPQRGYKNCVALGAPDGCNCDWNRNWCGQKSIDTHCGRACGDYPQRMVCVRRCPEGKKCPTDCHVGEWGQWGACDGKKETRTRPVLVPAKDGGEACPETEQTQKCDYDCTAFKDMGLKRGNDNWDCPEGYHNPVRAEAVQGDRCFKIPTFTTWPARGYKNCMAIGKPNGCGCDWNRTWCGQKSIDTTCGRACGDYAQRHVCVKGPINGGKPLDCAVGDFGDWTGCTKQCGGGTQNRVRVIIHEAANGGDKCPDLKEERACNEEECDNEICGQIRDMGLKDDEANWACPQGYRFPNMAEAKQASKCLNVPPFTTWPARGYKNCVALGAPQGCHCDWNNNWCRDKSIETTCGRACGDYAQRHVCIKADGGTHGGEGCGQYHDYGLKQARDAAGWNCPKGYEMPSMAQAREAAKCLKIPAFTTWRDRGYENCVAVGAPKGCNCDWNNNWCGQQSIETHCGRACGDHEQRHVCAKCGEDGCKGGGGGGEDPGEGCDLDIKDMGLHEGNDNTWKCPNGYRPTKDKAEATVVAGCLKVPEFTTWRNRGYKNCVAYGTPNGCGCDWNKTWCRDKSIDTHCGRACGDYAQRFVCVKQGGRRMELDSVVSRRLENSIAPPPPATGGSSAGEEPADDNASSIPGGAPEDDDDANCPSTGCQ